MNDFVLWTEIQVQENRNISAKSLRSSRSTGVLWGTAAPSFIRAGGKILYKPSTIDAWLSQFEEVKAGS